MTVKENTKDALIFVAALGIPVVAASQGIWGFLADILVIVPFVWLGLRRSISWSVLSLAAAVLGIYAVTLSPELAISKGLLILGISFVFSWGIKNGWRPGKIMFWAALPAVAYGFYSFLQLAPGPLLQRDPITIIEQALAGNIDTIMEQYRKVGFLQAAKAQGLDEAQLRRSLIQSLQIMAKLVPALLFVSGIFNVGLSFLLTRYVLKRGLGINIPLGPFRTWSVPWYAVWGAIIGLAFYLAGDRWGIAGMTITGLNIGVVYFLISLFLGVSVALFFFFSPRIPLLFKLTFMFLAIYDWPVTSIILAVFGLFDMVMNFRKLPAGYESGGKI